MNFLNAMLLGGAGAMLAPLLLHLLNRTQLKHIDWGATQLLESALKINSRRIEWIHWLLLAIRIAFPIILAICLARPVLTHFRTAAAGSKSVAILLDDSLSMSAPTTGSTSRLIAAQESLTQILSDFDVADASLHTTSFSDAQTVHSLANNLETVQLAIRRTEASQQSSRSVEQLIAAIEAVTKSPAADKHVVLASDFQVSQWSNISNAQAERVHNALNQTPFPVNLTLLPASDGARKSNIAVRIATTTPMHTWTDQPTRIAASVTNWSDAPTSCELTLQVDNQSIQKKSLDIPAQESREITFACEFSKPGWHAIGIQAAADDGLSNDNTAYHVIHVNSALRVGLISNSTGPEAEGLEFIESALAPYTGQDSARNRFSTTLLTAPNITSEKLRNLTAVIMADAPSLGEKQTQAIESFVQSGGSLIVFASEKAESHSATSPPLANSRLMPLTFGSPQTRHTQATAPPVAIQSIDQLRPALANSLSSTTFTRWLPLLSPTSSDQVHQPASTPGAPLDVFLRLADGTPLMAGSAFGSGYVVQAGFSLSSNSSNLALRPAFPPLLQQLVLANTSLYGDTQQTIAGQVKRWKAADPADSFTVSRIAPAPIPAGFAASPASESGTFAKPQTHTHFRSSEAGVYQVNLIPSAELANLPDTPPLTMFSVGLPPEESNLNVLAPKELDALAKRLGGRVTGNAEQFKQQQHTRQHGKEIWPWLLALAIGLLVCESWLAARITRGEL